MKKNYENLGDFKRYGKELRFEYCPICKDKKDNPCFTLNSQTDVYFCHTTGQSGHIKQLKGFEELDTSVFKKENNFNEVKETIDFGDTFLKTENFNKEWINYLTGRSISEKTAKKVVRLGKFNQMAIPISNGEKIVGIKYRSMDKKIFSEPGTATNLFINYNSIKTRDYLIIVEGEIDLMSALEVGYENVVSLPFGAGNTRVITHQIDWLKEFKKIIIATDNDDVGKRCKREIIEKLYAIKSKLYEIDMKEHKDFNEILVNSGTKKLQEIIKKSKKIIKNSWSEFIESEDGYSIATKDGYSKLTNFRIDLNRYSDNFFEGLAITEGREREFNCTKTELLDKSGIMRNMGFYLGSSQSIVKFLYWIEQENKDLYVKEIPHYGIIKDNYYDKNSDVICGKKDLYFKNFNEISSLTPDDEEWLNNNLLDLRKDKVQSLLGICWAIGRFHQDGTYPILDVCGTTSIGKTEYVDFISRIMFGTEDNIKNFTTMSNHQIRSIASCSNITPFCIDEIKMTGKNTADKADMLYSTLRSVYDNKTINQGNTSDKLTEFKLCTPLIISGESQLSDVSIKNRVINISLTKNNKSEYEVFQVFKHSDILYKLGKRILENRLKNKIEVSVGDVKRLLKNTKDDRQLYNAKCLLQGYKALKEVVVIDKSIDIEFIKHLDEVFSEEYTPEKNFLKLLDLVLESGVFYKNFYIKDDRGHYANFSLLYKAISLEHQKTNSTLELLDMETIKKQLKESEFLGIYTNKRFDDELLGTSRKQAKAYTFRV